MKTIYLIRHCKATGQEPESPLSEVGFAQAEQLADFFSDRPIDCLISSPFERAQSTAHPMAQQAGLEINTDQRLRERRLTTEDVEDWLEKLKETFTVLDLKLPGGESSREAMERGIAVIHGVLESLERHIALVTHGNLMSLILKHFNDDYGFDEWRGLTNPDVYQIVVHEDDQIQVKRIWDVV